MITIAIVLFNFVCRNELPFAEWMFEYREWSVHSIVSIVYLQQLNSIATIVMCYWGEIKAEWVREREKVREIDNNWEKEITMKNSFAKFFRAANVY